MLELYQLEEKKNNTQIKTHLYKKKKDKKTKKSLFVLYLLWEFDGPISIAVSISLSLSTKKEERTGL